MTLVFSNVLNRQMLVGGLAYFLLAKFGMALFSLQPSNITLLWLPSGIGLLMSLSAGIKALPIIFLASFFANFHGLAQPSLSLQFLHTLISASADAFAAWFAASMARRHLPLGLSKPIDLIPFTLFVCVIPTLASATMLAANLVWGGYILRSQSIDFILMLLVSDSLGILLCYPLLETWKARHRITSAEIKHWLVLTGCTVGIVHLSFVWLPPLIFLLIPAFLYMIFSRHHAVEHPALVLVICLIVAEAARDLGPFQLADPEHGRLMLVFFLFSTAMTVTGMWLQQRQLLAEQTLIANQQVQLSKAKDAAETANIAKSAFLANMSHEMRTPLHQISGMAQMVKREPLSPKQVDRMRILDQAVGHMLNLVEVVLKLTQIEASKLELAEKPLSINDVVGDELIARLRDKAVAKGLQFIVESAELPVGLLGDSNHIRDALFQYADNAVRFTESGRVTIRVKVVEEDTSSALLRFEVEDTGIGIAAEVLPRLFSIFEQADNSLTRKYGGAGIGLAMTKKISQLMGGDAGCESSPSEGSTFWFTVRLKKSSA